MEQPNQERTEVTRLLEAISSGKDSGDRLFELLYAELHQLARAKMNRERDGHTLQSTALVHEAYSRLLGGGDCPWKDRGHFLAVAGLAMRRILVEHARQRGAERRGGRVDHVPFDAELMGVPAGSESAVEIVALDEALKRLEVDKPRVARVVNLKYFVGLSAEETAQALDVSLRTVQSDWAYAKAWLYRELEGESRNE